MIRKKISTLSDRESLFYYCILLLIDNPIHQKNIQLIILPKPHFLDHMEQRVLDQVLFHLPPAGLPSFFQTPLQP